MAFISVLQFRNNRTDHFISIRKSSHGSGVAYISSSISLHHPSADVEVDISERKIRVICGDGFLLGINQSGNLGIPSCVVSSILDDEEKSRRIKLTKQDDGWFYGEF